MSTSLLTLTLKGSVELPTTAPVQTLLDDVRVSIQQDGEGWKVSPGDISVISIKEVRWEALQDKNRVTTESNIAGI